MRARSVNPQGVQHSWPRDELAVTALRSHETCMEAGNGSLRMEVLMDDLKTDLEVLERELDTLQHLAKYATNHKLALDQLAAELHRLSRQVRALRTCLPD